MRPSRPRPWRARSARAALALALSACSSPGGGGAWGDPDTGAAVLFPDVVGDGAGGTDSAASSSCDEDQGCNDLDPCTVDDRCVAGVCQGVAVACDDGVSCTTDYCAQGLCRHEVAAGSCLIGGVCWSDGQPHPTNPCRRCDAAASPDAWTDADGLKCSDGAPCTDGETCAAGACTGGVAVGGDGCEATDPPTTCETHYDCYPERVCLRWRADDVKRCSEPCGGPGDCADGEVCSLLPGAAQVAACEAVPPDTLGDGEACGGDDACASGLCVDGVCRAGCVSQSRCSADGLVCRALDTVGAADAGSACVPAASGTLGMGQVCSADGGASWASALCASNHCDLMPWPATTALPCAPLCRAEGDCGLGQECGVVLYAPAADPATVAFHPQLQAATHAAVTACFSTPGTGTKAPGAPCVEPGECRSGKCLHLLPGESQRYCSALCGSDADCPSGMRCKLDTLTLASAWLQAPSLDTQPPLTSAWTLVRVCKFE